MTQTSPSQELQEEVSRCKEAIAPRLTQIQKNIQTLGQKNSKGQSAQVLAVTKTVGLAEMLALYQLGIHNFGENRVEIFLDKVQAFKNFGLPVTWHYIGRIQSRQVKKIIDHIDVLHSLDRLSLAKEIQKRASHPINCFLEVNVSGEDSKAGFEAEELEEVFPLLGQYDKIRIIGLMTMAPISAKEDDLHQIFGRLRQLRDKWSTQNLPNGPINQLSMGMSRDYPIALEEGSTIIRVGTYLYQDLN